MKKQQWISLLGAMALAMAGMTAAADYKAASRALQNKDYAAALPLLQESARAGDNNAMNDLGQMYWKGAGVPVDQDKALDWLKKAANAGNAAAMNALAHLYLAGGSVPRDVLAARRWAEKSALLGNANSATVFYQTVTLGPEFDYKTDGKPDMAKYNALAKRRVEERVLDRKAYDMLGKAVEGGDATGRLMAAGEAADKVGPGNRARALALMDAKPLLPVFANLKRQIETLSSLGDSYTNLSTFVNARQSAEPAAAIMGRKAGVIADGVCSVDELKVMHTAVSRPLAGAVYLPTSSHDLQNVDLIAGNWQETWSFDACGKAIDVPIEFQADGFGGASYYTRISPTPGPDAAPASSQ